VSEIKLFRICSHCNKEFQLKHVTNLLNGAVCSFESCSHCNKRNDTWVKVENRFKQELSRTKAELEEAKEVIRQILGWDESSKVVFRVNRAQEYDEGNDSLTWTVTNEELITKKQHEIENLKKQIQEIKDSVGLSRNELCFAEQWSTKCKDFPDLAMKTIVKARHIMQCI